MVRNHMSLHDLYSGMKLLPQILVNVRFTGNHDPGKQSTEVQQVSQKAEAEQKARLLLRKIRNRTINLSDGGRRNEAQVTAMANRIADAVKRVKHVG